MSNNQDLWCLHRNQDTMGLVVRLEIFKTCDVTWIFKTKMRLHLFISINLSFNNLVNNFLRIFVKLLFYIDILLFVFSHLLVDPIPEVGDTYEHSVSLCSVARRISPADSSMDFPTAVGSRGTNEWTTTVSMTTSCWVVRAVSRAKHVRCHLLFINSL